MSDGHLERLRRRAATPPCPPCPSLCPPWWTVDGRHISTASALAPLIRRASRATFSR